MKVKVIGSHLCPDTLYALCKLSEKHVDMEFKNLSASLPDLKEYLAARDSDPLYEAVKAGVESGFHTLYWRMEARRLIWTRSWRSFN